MAVSTPADTVSSASAADTSRILSQAWQPRGAGNDNSWNAVVKELQELRKEVAEFREERNQGDDIVAAGAQANVNATNETTQAVKEQTSAARQKGYERRYGT